MDEETGTAAGAGERRRPPRPLRTPAAAVLVAGALWTVAVWLPVLGVAGPDAQVGGWRLANVQGLTVVLAWVTTTVWLGRAHDVAYWLEPCVVRLGRNWTWAAWVVPILALWYPKQLVDDVWASLARLPGRRPPQRTGLWWLFWLFAAGLQSATSGLVVADPGLEALWGGYPAAVVTTVAYLLWIPVVLGLTRAYDGPATGR